MALAEVWAGSAGITLTSTTRNLSKAGGLGWADVCGVDDDYSIVTALSADV